MICLSTAVGLLGVLEEEQLKLRVFLLIFIVGVMSFYGLYWFYNQNFSKALLPKKIEVSGFALIKEEFLITEGCGIKVFDLSKSTLDQINQQGLAFFEDATQARGYDPDKHRYNHYYSYTTWQETPIQESQKNKNFWVGLSCAKGLNLDESLYAKIKAAASTKGSYYTGHIEGQLIVIPSLGIVVFSYMG